MQNDAHDLTFQLGGVWRNGRGNAACPVCQPEKRRDQTALSITEANGKLLLHCFKSDCDFHDIVVAAGLPPETARADHHAARDADQKRTEYAAAQLAKARAIWDAAKPITGTKAEAYLRARGITAPMPASLRFAPDIHHGPSCTWGCAMVADVAPTGGIHRTFFDKKGHRLPKSAKMMLGPCSGGAVRLSEGAGPLVVAEGIETGLSLLSGLLSGPANVWATLSTSGLKALQLPSQAGELFVATDGDAPGAEAGEVLASRAFGLGWRVSLMPAPAGQDWNDVLQQRRAA